MARQALIDYCFHALIVINAKEHCRKKSTFDGCPLGDGCGKRGL
jgi:endonuclease-3 related protein